MNLFINREKELGLLSSLYSKKAAALAVIYGRRRLGKTCLLKEFSQNYPEMVG